MTTTIVPNTINRESGGQAQRQFRLADWLVRKDYQTA
jgi:hypothetical protein